MPAKHSDYRSFLVRLWWNDSSAEETLSVNPREPPASDDKTPRGWWMTALDPKTGEQWGFADLGQLLAFFQEQIRLHSATGKKT